VVKRREYGGKKKKIRKGKKERWVKREKWFWRKI
jgi:hypothetical protein